MCSDKPVVTALVLAAGLGRRMGGPNKLLLPVQGVAIVRRVVDEALASRCAGVVVVLGHEAERVRGELDGLPVQFVLNKDYEEGMGSSVRVGARAVRDDSAVLVCLGDMPWVEAAVIDALIQAYRPGQGIKACQPTQNGQRGNPVLWGAASLPALRRLGGDEGARSLLRSLGDALALVEVGARGILSDVDTPADLGDLGEPRP